ncbi:hypothetical protein SAMN02745178_00031 [Gemmiger formicilis]|uniref:Uncharacterized protein n=1 Tax=Gemmiger formicilis TaxID=745368 RepID=A0A1T4W6J9_9FIRM|nr:hypothetical protein [Gemmiger formicilis]SKA72900.1 hypothetical protein SAMN02745178_00031 [Gemmiger formicilis]
MQSNNERGENGPETNTRADSATPRTDHPRKHEKHKQHRQHPKQQNQTKQHGNDNTPNSTKQRATIQHAPAIAQRPRPIKNRSKSRPKTNERMATPHKENARHNDQGTTQQNPKAHTITQDVTNIEEKQMNHSSRSTRAKAQTREENAIAQAKQQKGKARDRTRQSNRHTANHHPRSHLTEDSTDTTQDQPANTQHNTRPDKDHDKDRHVGKTNSHKRLQNNLGQADARSIQSDTENKTTVTSQIQGPHNQKEKRLGLAPHEDDETTSSRHRAQHSPDATGHRGPKKAPPPQTTPKSPEGPVSRSSRKPQQPTEGGQKRTAEKAPKPAITTDTHSQPAAGGTHRRKKTRPKAADRAAQSKKKKRAITQKTA